LVAMRMRITREGGIRSAVRARLQFRTLAGYANTGNGMVQDRRGCRAETMARAGLRGTVDRRTASRIGFTGAVPGTG